MPLDLLQNRGPIDETDATFRDVLGDLQGNILVGHGRFHAVHLFLHFPNGSRASVRSWIAGFAATRVTSALEQARASQAYRETEADAGVFAHFALSAAGYRRLGFEEGAIPRGSNPLPRPLAADDGARQRGDYTDVYSDGMATRQPFLLDPPRDEWEAGYDEDAHPIHAMVLLAADDPAELVAVERVVVSQLEPIVDIAAVERGINLKKRFYPEDAPDGVAVEHFGYVDGRSEPLFLMRHVMREVPAGGGSFWDPRAPLNLVLVPDPNGTPMVSFGSFLVYRKLEQNVRGFKQAEARVASELGLPRALVGAMAVGRFEDGTPLVLQPGDGARPIPNDFNYGGDAKGQTCPFHAHIRKSNPRLESVKIDGPFAKTPAEELGHRIARRGIPYGGPLSEGDNLDALPTRGVGLLFFCYQADIWEQFEFMQRFWCNNPVFLEPGLGGPGQANYSAATGLDAVIGQQRPGQSDPIIGQEPDPPRNWPDGWGRPTRNVAVDFARFVTLKGGEYLFSPCLSFLKGLAHPEALLLRASTGHDAGGKPPEAGTFPEAGTSQEGGASCP